MAHKSEFLFVDPFVPDLKTLLEHLRPEVQAVVLDHRQPAAKQMAETLKGIDRTGRDPYRCAWRAGTSVLQQAGEWSA